MKRPWPPTSDWLEGALRRAILEACRDGWQLLGRDASERSLMFRVGRYLAPAIEDPSDDRLRVDLEYNRIASDGKPKVIKQVRGLSSLPDKKRSVLPALAIHDRSGFSKLHNFLVVEAKKAPAGRREVEFDIKKLETYKCELMRVIHAHFS